MDILLNMPSRKMKENPIKFYPNLNVLNTIHCLEKVKNVTILYKLTRNTTWKHKTKTHFKFEENLEVAMHGKS
jgi:hypothetical protein